MGLVERAKDSTLVRFLVKTYFSIDLSRKNDEFQKGCREAFKMGVVTPEQLAFLATDPRQGELFERILVVKDTQAREKIAAGVSMAQKLDLMRRNLDRMAQCKNSL